MVSELGRLSISSIRRHKLRSVLTTLGIILGVGSIVGMVSLSASFENSFLSSYSNSFLPNEFAVGVGMESLGGGSAQYNIVPLPVFTQHDLNAIGKISGISSVLPMGQITTTGQNAVTVNNSTIFAASVTGTTSALGGFLPLCNGTAFSSTGQAVVGYSVARTVASGLHSNDTSSALGKVISVNFGRNVSGSFQISGVLADSPIGYNDLVLVNLSYYHETSLLNGTEVAAYTGLLVLTGSVSQLNSVEQATVSYLKESSQARYILNDYSNLKMGFITVSNAQVVQFIVSSVQQFSGFIIALGSVALLVGMIGIANIMLVSVSERMREVGILRAIGAKRSEIAIMFLIEVSIMGVIGSAVGLLFGFSLALIILKLGIFGSSGTPLIIDWVWVPIAILLGIAVSLLSGMYPAYKASRILPTEALRNE